MSSTKIKFEFEKETKNSVRFKEIPQAGIAPVVGTIYLQKWFIGQAKSISISIEKLE